MWYSLLADTIVALHVAYVSFVVLGQLAIWIGAILRWSFIRNFWFRSIHLSMMLIVAIEAAFAIECPMTEWERDLRVAAGETSSAESFVGRMMQSILFQQWEPETFVRVYFAIGAVVLGTFVFIPPRRDGRSWQVLVGAPLMMMGVTFSLFIQWNIGIALAGTGFVLLATAPRPPRRLPVDSTAICEKSV